jgi:hypothetical protein
MPPRLWGQDVYPNVELNVRIHGTFEDVDIFENLMLSAF